MESKLRTFTPTLVVTTFFTCFGSSMLYGYNLAIINLPKPHIKEFLRNTLLNGSESSGTVDAEFLYAAITSTSVVGGAIGAFSTGWVADFFGRRNGLLFNHMFMIAGAICAGPVVVLQTPYLLFVSRFLVGVNCGITIGLASMYLTELAPRSVRGAVGGSHQLAVTVGIIVAYLLTMNFSLNGPKFWPIALALTGVPSLISLVLTPIFCPESPRYLFMNRGRREDAHKAFVAVNEIENAELFFAELHEEHEFAQSRPKFKFIQIFIQGDLRMPLLIACLVQVMQQLSGINAIISYSSTMLRTAGLEPEASQYSVLAIGILNVICTITSLPLLEKFGRRTLLLLPSLLLVVSLGALTLFTSLVGDTSDLTKVTAVQKLFGYISVGFILLYIVGFALGLGPIPAMIVSEIFRQEPRGTAYSISQFLQWLSNLVVLLSYPSINKEIGGLSFLPFLVVVAACWVFFFLFLPETRNRTFDEIARSLAFGNVVLQNQEATFLSMEEEDSVAKKSRRGNTAA